MAGHVVGVVSEIHRYPVKSMLGETLTKGSFNTRGLAGDRVFALVDDETGKLVSAKRPKRWGRMLELRASGDASAGDDIAIQVADGSTVVLTSDEAASKLSEMFGRPVSVATSLPAGAIYDEEWAGELKNDAEPYMAMETYTEDGEEMINGGSFMAIKGDFFDFGALHLVTTSTLRRLGELAPESRFEPARFRPNIVVETAEEGFAESAWAGQHLSVGGAGLAVSFTVPRCVMTTLPMGDDLPGDRAVLRTITEHNSVDVLGNGAAYPCVGVYADVTTDGEIAVGDEVILGPTGS